MFGCPVYGFCQNICTRNNLLQKYVVSSMIIVLYNLLYEPCLAVQYMDLVKIYALEIICYKNTYFYINLTDFRSWFATQLV
jgi:hypothetical protein